MTKGMYMLTKTTLRPLHEIAQEALNSASLQGSVRIHSSCYLGALTHLTSIQECYDEESGKSLLLYALHNLQYWRGEDAKRIKAEFKAHLGK